VNQLEGLLAASEAEVGALREALRNPRVERNRGEVALLERVFRKEGEVKESQAVVSLLQVKLGKAEGRLGHLTEYVQSLPSQEELEEARGEVATLQGERDVLQGQLGRMWEAAEGLRRDLGTLEREKRALEIR